MLRMLQLSTLWDRVAFEIECYHIAPSSCIIAP